MDQKVFPCGASPYPNPVLCPSCQGYTPALQLFCAVLHRLVGLKPEPVSLDALAARTAIGQRASMLTKVETQRLGSISRDCHRSIGSARMATDEPTRQGTEALSCWSLGLYQMCVHSSAYRLRTQSLGVGVPATPHTCIYTSLQEQSPSVRYSTVVPLSSPDQP